MMSGSSLLHACVLLFACSSVLADENVSITLLHDLGDGMVPAGTVTGNLPENVWPSAQSFINFLHHLAFQTVHPYTRPAVLFSLPDRVESVQVLHKHKLSIQWNVADEAVEQLKQLAINDGYFLMTSGCFFYLSV